MVNELTSRKTDKSSIKEIKLDGVSLIKSGDVPNASNDHFSSIGPKLVNEIPLLNNTEPHYQKYVRGNDNEFDFRPFDSKQVLTLLNKLNKSKVYSIKSQFLFLVSLDIFGKKETTTVNRCKIINLKKHLRSNIESTCSLMCRCHCTAYLHYVHFPLIGKLLKSHPH